MSVNAFAPSRYHKIEPFVNPSYDKVVDRSDFKRGQDKERATRLSGDTGGSLTQGVYDFPDGVIDDKKSPTTVELALRKGKLDKADVDTLQRLEKQRAQEQQENSQSEFEKAKQKSIEQQRQDYLDSKTGFSPNSSTE